MKASGPVNRVELECQVLCAALRQSWVRQDKVGAFTSIRELSHLFPDLLPPPEEKNGSNKANYYDVLSVRPQSGLNAIMVGYLRRVRSFLRDHNAKDHRTEFNTILNAGFVLRKPRLRLSHDLVVARRWLYDTSETTTIRTTDTIESKVPPEVRPEVPPVVPASQTTTTRPAPSVLPVTQTQPAAVEKTPPPLPPPVHQAPAYAQQNNQQAASAETIEYAQPGYRSPEAAQLPPPLPRTVQPPPIPVEHKPVTPPPLPQTSYSTPAIDYSTPVDYSQPVKEQQSSQPLQQAAAFTPPPIPALPETVNTADEGWQTAISQSTQAKAADEGWQTATPPQAQSSTAPDDGWQTATPPIETRPEKSTATTQPVQPPPVEVSVPHLPPGQTLETPAQAAPPPVVSAPPQKVIAEYTKPAPETLPPVPTVSSANQAPPPEVRTVDSARSESIGDFVFDESQLRKPEAKIDLPPLIKLMEAAHLITSVEVQALKAQIQLAPNIAAEQLVMNAGYATKQEISSLHLAQDLLARGRITMAQFQVAMYDERTSNLRMAESLQVRGWLESETRNTLEG